MSGAATIPIKRYPIGSIVICRPVRSSARLTVARIVQHKAEGLDLIKTYHARHDLCRVWDKAWRYEIYGTIDPGNARHVDQELAQLAVRFKVDGDILVPAHLRAVFEMCQA